MSKLSFQISLIKFTSIVNNGFNTSYSWKALVLPRDRHKPKNLSPCIRVVTLTRILSKLHNISSNRPHLVGLKVWDCLFNFYLQCKKCNFDKYFFLMKKEIRRKRLGHFIHNFAFARSYNEYSNNDAKALTVSVLVMFTRKNSSLNMRRNIHTRSKFSTDWIWTHLFGIWIIWC